VENGKEGPVIDWTHGELPLDADQNSSTYTELLGVLRGLATLSGLDGQTVLIQSDNQATVYGLAKGGYCASANANLNLMAKKVMMVCMLRDIRLVASYIGSQGVIDSGADHLSRLGRGGNWDDEVSLRPEVFDYLCQGAEAMGVVPQVDLFATGENVRGGLGFFSRYDDDSAACWGVDGLRQAWPKYGYAFPPFGLTQVVVEKAEDEARRRGTYTILVVQDCGKTWFAQLARYPRLELGKLQEVTTPAPRDNRPIEQRPNPGLVAFLVGPDV
jgi:hypothetical protein